MSFDVRIKCRGPKCRRSKLVPGSVHGRLGLILQMPPGWIQDPGHGEWCSEKCHRAWLKARLP